MPTEKPTSSGTLVHWGRKKMSKNGPIEWGPVDIIVNKLYETNQILFSSVQYIQVHSKPKNMYCMVTGFVVVLSVWWSNVYTKFFSFFSDL